MDENKKILYILFGYSSNKVIVDDYATVLALNVSDPKAVSIVSSTQQEQETQQPSSTPMEDKASSSNGATIGGAIGGAIGVTFFFSIQ